MSYKKLSFVMPVYNEEKTLKEIVSKIQAVDLGNIEKEFVLVNDCSKDNTKTILNQFKNQKGFIILENEKNLGKSQTVKKGISATTGDLVVIHDADLEYDPEDLKPFVESFQTSDIDLIYGNRFGVSNKIIYLQNWIGNRTLSLFSAIFTGLRAKMWTSDMEVCYKMAKGNIFREIGATIVSTSKFGLEPEITAKFSKYKTNGKHLKFKQIPIHYYARTIEQGKHMNAWKDGYKALKEILYFNLLHK